MNTPAKLELLKFIDPSREWLGTGAVDALANAKGLHLSSRMIQDYLLHLERMKLIELERIRKGQWHSQRIRMIVGLDCLR